MPFKLIDLFSGAGGMTLGFTNDQFGGGFESVWAIDNDEAAVRTYRANFGDHAICDDIEKWARPDTDVPEADVVIGGPPCQGFSLLNRNRSGDLRRALWKPFLDIVKKSAARVFVIENVRELIRSDEFNEIAEYAYDLGYGVVGEVLTAADFGAPQTRHRAIIVGWHLELGLGPKFPPTKTHSPKGGFPGTDSWRTVRDVISDLDEPKGTSIRNVAPPYDLHFGRNPTDLSRQRYKLIPPGGNRFDLQERAPEITPNCWLKKKSGGTDLFGRLWWDRPSVTIRTEFFKPEKGRYLHPQADRPITHREAARLMGFPDSHKFVGSKTEIARQIGNAVPPHLAGAVSKEIASFLSLVDDVSNCSAKPMCAAE